MIFDYIRTLASRGDNGSGLTLRRYYNIMVIKSHEMVH